jgi:hypothetical protein
VLEDGAEHDRRSGGHVQRQHRAAQFRAEQVGDRDPGVRLTEVDGEQHPPAIVEPDPPGGAAAGGGEALRLVDETQPGQGVEPTVEGSAGHPGLGEQLLSGQPPAQPDQLQQVTGAGGDRSRCRAHHLDRTPLLYFY